mmetsp:Transcript_54866/g.169912  ORF Transcript_54866/g.169912 Transcript_54866/m.169912 type:complete len:219 (+) Transcript_54866:98-754(+)
MSGGLYSVLGVSRSATRDTVRLAYLRLAKQLHPDVNKSSAAVENFRRVREAYEVLSDDARRREHDRQLDVRGLANAAGSSSASSSSSRPTEHERKPPGAPFGASHSKSYWEVYERARRAEQSTGAWHQRTQQGQDNFAHANAQYREAFDRERYRQRLSMGLLRVVPLLAPVWVLAFLLTLRKSSQSGPDQFVTFDSFGRAYVQDAYGRPHRMPDFDRQ